MKNKLKLIHIFGTPNGYSLLNDSNKPDVILDETPQGIVGIYKEHWCNLMSDALLSVSSDYGIEIWQPDVRTKKVVSHTFENGLIHYLFPSDNTNYGPGELSPLVNHLSKNKNGNVILHLHEWGNPLTQSFLYNTTGNNYKYILLQYGGFTYRKAASGGKNLLRRAKFYLQSLKEKKILREISAAIAMYKQSADELKKVYDGPVYFNTMGINFSEWYPGNKKESRNILNISQGRKVLLSASMLRRKKQIDRLINVMITIDKETGEDFLLLIVGGGDDPEYEKEIKASAAELVKKDKIRFLGRISNEELLTYYHASDLFLLLSSGEGSPVGVMKAHACSIPVITTDFGQAPEVLRKHNAGLVVNNELSVWKDNIIKYLKADIKIKPLDHAVAEELYDWKNVSGRYDDIYKKIF